MIILPKPTNVILLEDNIYKAMDIKSALRFCGINDRDVIWEKYQDVGFERIQEYARQNTPIQLIITDMHYPLRAGAESDWEAGFKLLKRLKQEELDVPVIICSTGNFESVASEVLGTVYYNPNRDLNWDLKEILEKL